MTDTGFRFFIESLQELNAPPKPKRIPTQTAPAYIPSLSFPASLPSLPNEDYVGSICLLHKLTKKTPAYQEVLLDIKDFERLQHMSWRIDRWGKNKEKYAVRKNGIQIARYILNAPAGKVVDHIRSERTLDNRRFNIRLATQGQHQVNTRRQKNGTSRYKGVQQHPSTGKWFVHCGPRNDRIYVGGFDTEIEAARAYNRIATELYGSMAYLNPV